MNSSFHPFLLEGERQGQRYRVAVPQTALAGLAGNLLSRRPGSSIEFQEHRDYQPGDDLRRMDWNIYARTDRLVIKLHREEVNPHLDLVLDGSRSMSLENTAKGQAVCFLAALLAVAASNAGCSHSVWLGQGGFRRLHNDRGLPSTWTGLSFEGTRTLAEDFQILRPVLKRQGIRVLISDLMFPGDPLAVLRRLADGAAGVLVIQLLARDDLSTPEPGSLRLVDSETAEELDLYLDPQAARHYQQALARHQNDWQEACRQVRSHQVALEAETLLESFSLRSIEETGFLLPA